MRALDRKLVRDLRTLRGQVITIALVVACGIASYVTTMGCYYSLLSARDAYYERYRFPDLFAHVERAPEALLPQLEALPDVATAYARVVEQVSLPLDGLAEPVTAQLVSLPADRVPPLGAISLRRGRLFAPGRADEVIVLEAFATAHALALGERIPVVINGVLRRLTIVGTALSPEYVFALAPGELIPDPRRFGVLWMDHDVVAASFQMRGAFNDLVIRLQPGASSRAAIDTLNRLLAPYGASGAYDRDRQLSNSAVRSELAQLESMTAVIPMIFLGVAALLINVVLSRLVQLQRMQIALLKALGYRDRRIGLHYLQLVTVVVLLGAALGVGAGAWLGGLLTDLYDRFYHFPALRYRLQPRVLAVALSISVVSAVVGALFAVRTVVKLPPAEAMRPEAPTLYRRAISERLPVKFLFGQAGAMVLRELERRPLRALLSALGIALAVAMLVVGRFGFDAVEWFMDVQFQQAQREDLALTFVRPVPVAAARELAAIDGVLSTEGQRAVAVRFRSGHRARESVLVGHPPHAQLRRIVDERGRVYEPGEDELLLTRKLAEILQVRPGQRVTVEVLEGKRGSFELPVTGTIEEVFGLQGHMRLGSVSRLLREEPRISAALLSIDTRRAAAVYRELKRKPLVLAVNSRSAAISAFRTQTAGQMSVSTLIFTVFACIIAGGVIYNNARVALSTRSHDFASLRVLGFRRAEISAILLGELAIQVLVALGPGMLLGAWMAKGMMAQADPEMIRFPVVISAQTYAFAALVTLGAGLASALLVRRRLDHLDLIAVLKTRA